MIRRGKARRYAVLGNFLRRKYAVADQAFPRVAEHNENFADALGVFSAHWAALATRAC
jgi:hypothetical protein